MTGGTLPATITLTGPTNKTFQTDGAGRYRKIFKVEVGDYTLSIGGVDFLFTKNKCDQCVVHNFDGEVVVGGGDGIFVSPFVNQFV